MISPEAIGGGAEIEFQRVGYSEARLDFAGGKTDNALLMGDPVSNRTLYMGLGVSPTVDIFVRVPQESSSLLGVKVQVLGAPSKVRNNTHQLAFTLAIGSERDSFEGTYEIDLKSDVRDYSLIYGFRFTEYALIYSSISVSTYSFEGDITNSGGATLSDDSIDYTASNILGGQLGLELGGDSFALKLELAAQKIKWTNSEEKLLYSSGLSIRATF